MFFLILRFFLTFQRTSFFLSRINWIIMKNIMEILFIAFETQLKTRIYLMLSETVQTNNQLTKSKFCIKLNVIQMLNYIV